MIPITELRELLIYNFLVATGFMYGNVYDEEKRFESHAVYPKLLCQRAHDFSWVGKLD